MTTVATRQALLFTTQTMLIHLQEEIDEFERVEAVLKRAIVLVTAAKALRFPRLRSYLNKIKERKKRELQTVFWKRPQTKNIEPEELLGRHYDVKQLTGLEEDVFDDVFELVKGRMSQPRERYLQELILNFSFLLSFLPFLVMGNRKINVQQRISLQD